MALPDPEIELSRKHLNLTPSQHHLLVSQQNAGVDPTCVHRGQQSPAATQPVTFYFLCCSLLFDKRGKVQTKPLQLFRQTLM